MCRMGFTLINYDDNCFWYQYMLVCSIFWTKGIRPAQVHLSLRNPPRARITTWMALSLQVAALYSLSSQWVWNGLNGDFHRLTWMEGHKADWLDINKDWQNMVCVFADKDLRCYLHMNISYMTNRCKTFLLKNNYIFHDQQLQNVTQKHNWPIFVGKLYVYKFVYVCMCQCILAKSDRCFIIIKWTCLLIRMSYRIPVKVVKKEPFSIEFIDMVPWPFLRYELNSGYVMPKKTAKYIYK